MGQSYRELIAWQKAMDLADLVYDITDAVPARERFGLAYQMRKSAVSIPAEPLPRSRKISATNRPRIALRRLIPGTRPPM